MGNEDSQAEQGKGKGKEQQSRVRQAVLRIHVPQAVRQLRVGIPGGRPRKPATANEVHSEDHEDLERVSEILTFPPRSPGVLIASGIIWLAAFGWFVSRLAVHGSRTSCATTLFGLSALFLFVGAATLLLAIYRRPRDIATLYEAGRQLVSDLHSRKRSTMAPRHLKSLDDLMRIERVLRRSGAGREAADLAKDREGLDVHRERIGR